ncbi:hypothetical protein H6G96_27560 [Nostoc sp. FACHB-892]|uniref:hypothetical protein n=1 Tax=Nostoc sp. FACHB-892 TaxID=2692843 RepID=UPI001684912A|nr:hypothetical protein [Nostoc sp. FACHB-892]MBD2729976.1 hypothetical protein [Nostoc sp. FACHB-892]
MARPEIDSEQRKVIKTTFRMTETESEAIKWYSGQFGLSVSEFLRLQLKPALEAALETTQGGKAS